MNIYPLKSSGKPRRRKNPQKWLGIHKVSKTRKTYNACNGGGRLRPAQLRTPRLPEEAATQESSEAADISRVTQDTGLAWWQRDPRAKTNPA